MSPEKKRDIAIIGDQASLYYDFQKNDIFVYNNHHEMQRDICVALKGGLGKSPIEFMEPLTTELKAFIDSVKNRSKPLADGKVGYEALKIVEACYESSLKGITVEIEW